MTGYGNSIRRIMELKDNNEGILGVIADIIKVEKQYETAIETALGGTIQNIVTDNEQTAKKLLLILRKIVLGVLHFFHYQLYRSDRHLKVNHVLKKMVL